MRAPLTSTLALPGRRMLETADGERLAAVLLPGPGATCVVLAHGFSGAYAKPDVHRVAHARRLAQL